MFVGQLKHLLLTVVHWPTTTAFCQLCHRRRHHYHHHHHQQHNGGLKVEINTQSEGTVLLEYRKIVVVTKQTEIKMFHGKKHIFLCKTSNTFIVDDSERINRLSGAFGFCISRGNLAPGGW